MLRLGIGYLIIICKLKPKVKDTSMISMDVFVLKSFPHPEQLKNFSSAGISFIRYQEELYMALNFDTGTKITPMDLHPKTIKIFDEEMKPADYPRRLSEEEGDYILITLKRMDFRIVATSLFDHCYPHEAASLSLGVVPNKVVYYCDKENIIKFRDGEVRDRAMILYDHNPNWHKERDKYYLPLCDHIEKLLINPTCDIDRILLNVIEETIFCKNMENELFTKYTRLEKQLSVYKNQNIASQIGKKGNKERNEPHEKAKIIALNYCRDLLQDENNHHLKSHEIIKCVAKHLSMNHKIFNPYRKQQGKKKAYSFKTIKSWINHLIPDNRKTIGSPKKEKPYGIYTVPND